MQRLVYIQKLCCFATHPLQSVDTTGTDVQTRDYHTQEYKKKASEKSDPSRFLSNLHPSILMCFHPLRLKSTIYHFKLGQPRFCDVYELKGLLLPSANRARNK